MVSYSSPELSSAPQADQPFAGGSAFPPSKISSGRDGWEVLSVPCSWRVLMALSKDKMLCWSPEPGLSSLLWSFMLIVSPQMGYFSMSLCFTLSWSCIAGTSGSCTLETPGLSLCSVVVYLPITPFVSQPGGEPGVGLCCC